MSSTDSFNCYLGIKGKIRLNIKENLLKASKNKVSLVTKILGQRNLKPNLTLMFNLLNLLI